MRILEALLIGLLFVACAAEQPRQSSSIEDPYDTDTVRQLIRYQQGSAQVEYGFIEKRNGQMGDAVSIALLKAYSDQELLRPELLRGYLPVIKAAFASPGFIVHKADLEPRVTLFLLRFIKNNINDAALLKQVKDLETNLLKARPNPARPSD